MIPDFTLVLGVDKSHLPHLQTVLPTWTRHKPSLLKRPLLVFYDYLDYEEILGNVHAWTADWDADIHFVPWPPPDARYDDPQPAPWVLAHEGDASRIRRMNFAEKWYHPQRVKMLSGFVHVPAAFVTTPYWLKLDLDVIATGHDDWIDERWFDDSPAIVSHPWGYTKPSTQMLMLDEWAKDHDLFNSPPLRLTPNPGSDLVRHKRIISWCGFFDTAFTRLCSELARDTCGAGQLPVPSQDGLMWYVATRGGLPIIRTNMKSRGWSHKSGLRNVRSEAEKAMGNHKGVSK